MACPSISLLILSDIHFGTLAEHQDFALAGTALEGHTGYSVSMREHLVEAVKQTGVKVDAILVPGDLTSRAGPGEFKACWNIIADFAQALGVDSRYVFHTYGNHDTNWRVSKLSQAEAETASDEHFKHIASSLGEYFCPISQDLKKGPLPGSGVYRSNHFELFIINSGFYSTHDQPLKHGKIGADQLNWLRRELQETGAENCWRILMLHHHAFNYVYPIAVHDISFLEEGDALVDLIGLSRVDFVCHGHRHHPIIRTRMENGWVSPVTFLCAGSVAVNANHRANGHIPNLFHIVTLEKRHPETRGALGAIQSFRFTIPNGWVLNDVSPTVPIEGVQRFGSIASEHVRHGLMAEVLKSASSDPNRPLVKLPPWNDLPADLRYTSVADTNNALTNAVEGFDGELYSKYPTQPVVVRTRA